MMYAIHCKMNNGCEGYFVEVETWSIGPVARISNELQTTSAAVCFVKNLPNVLSAEAREVVVVETALMKEALTKIKELFEYTDTMDDSDYTDETRALIARLEAVCTQ